MDVASIRFHNSAKHPFQVAPFEEVEVFEVGDPFTLRNGYVIGGFNPDGLLQTITTIDNGEKTDVKLEFIRYGTRARGDKSGAYLFLPDGEAKAMEVVKPRVRIIEGKIISYVEVFLPYVKHTAIIKSSPGNLPLVHSI